MCQGTGATDGYALAKRSTKPWVANGYIKSSVHRAPQFDSTIDKCALVAMTHHGFSNGIGY